MASPWEPPEVQGHRALARTPEGQHRKRNAASSGQTAAAPVPMTESAPCSFKLLLRTERIP